MNDEYHQKQFLHIVSYVTLQWVFDYQYSMNKLAVFQFQDQQDSIRTNNTDSFSI